MTYLYIVKFGGLQNDEDATLCDPVHLAKRRYNTFKEVGVPNDIDNSHTLSIIEQKMCTKDWKEWSRVLEREGKGRQGLMEWMTIEMKSRMLATAPLRTGSNSQCSINHVLGNVNSKGNTSWYKSWLCQNSAQWPDQSEVRCPKYR